VSDAGHSFHELRVARIVQETADTRSFVLDVPTALRPLFHYEAGQFLTFQIQLGATTLNRCYSLSSAPDCDDELQFTVKRVAGGRISNWFHDAIEAGQVLRVLPPTGGFTLRAGSRRPLAFFSGGSGITPVLSIVKTALATTERATKLVYANRDADSIIFGTTLAALADRNPGRLALVHHLDAERGLLDAARAREQIAASSRDAEFYLCGPGPFMELVERVLHEEGVPDERIFIERFEHLEASHASEDQLMTSLTPGEPVFANTSQVALAPPATITVHLDGAVHEIPHAAGDTLLQSARRAGLSPPAACEDGYCGCCMATLLQGEVAMAQCHALDDDERARGLILTCQARLVSGAVEVRWD
jgi:3-ketosteroid 9alpha-monooxygenase subunit B